jgi:hypothetical protein
MAYVQGVHAYRDAFGPEKKEQDAVIQELLPLLGTGYTADLLRSTAPTTVDADGLVNGPSLKDEQDWYAAHGFIKTPVNIEDVVDNSFAEHARGVLNAH